MRTYKLHLIRHGKIAEQDEGRYIGRTDRPLSTEGALLLQDTVSAGGYPKAAKVYSSPLKRCTQTAIVLYPNTFTEVVEPLSEFDYGEFEGRTIKQLSANPHYQSWMSGDMKTRIPGGESGEEFHARCTSALHYIIKDMMQEGLTECAIITHGGVIRHLLTDFALPQKTFTEWDIQNGRGYTILTDAAMWMRDTKFELYDTVPSLAASLENIDDDAYLDYAESLLDADE